MRGMLLCRALLTNGRALCPCFLPRVSLAARRHCHEKRAGNPASVKRTKRTRQVRNSKRRNSNIAVQQAAFARIPNSTATDGDASEGLMALYGLVAVLERASRSGPAYGEFTLGTDR